MASKNDLIFCRCCLNSCGEMKSLSHEPLRTVFVNLTNIQISSKDNFNWLCQYCSAFLKKIDIFKRITTLIDDLITQTADTFTDNEQEFVDHLKKNVDGSSHRSLSKSLIVSNSCNECINDEFSSVKNEIFFDNDNYDIDETNSVSDADPVMECKDEDVFVEEVINDSYTVRKKCKSKESPFKSAKKSKDFSFKKMKCSIENEKNNRRYNSLDLSKVSIVRLNKEQLLKEMDERRDSFKFINSKYKCNICVRDFSCREKLQKHNESHDESRGDYKCDICQMRFPNKPLLQCHKSNHLQRYRCRICNRSINVKKSMIAHLLRHENVYVCRTCGHESTDRTSFISHRKLHRSNEVFECHVCHKTLANKYILALHIRRHTGDMPFSCEICGKCFVNASNLTSHKSTHSTDKDYYCALCDINFKTENNMLVHLKSSSRHVDPKLLSVQCKLCPKKFKTDAECSSHVDSYHTRHARVACDMCPARFVTKNGLRNHFRRKHEGFKPTLSHVCETCGHGFSTKAQLTCHIRTHTGERPFKCETCQRRFTQRTSLRTHNKLVHLKIKRNGADSEQRSYVSM